MVRRRGAANLRIWLSRTVRIVLLALVFSYVLASPLPAAELLAPARPVHEVMLIVISAPSPFNSSPKPSFLQDSAPLPVHFSRAMRRSDRRLCYDPGRWLARKGIRVNCVGPGWTRTELIGHLTATPEMAQQIDMRHLLGRLAEPVEIAEAVIWLC